MLINTVTLNNKVRNIAMINLYTLLKASLSASDDEIRCALKRVANKEILDWEK